MIAPSMPEEKSKADSVTFTTEELGNISSLCEVLMKIHKRLIAEGHSIEELKQKLARDSNVC